MRKGAEYHVRARRKRDLENLRKLLAAHGKSPTGEVQSWPKADYRYRLIYTEEAIKDVYALLCANLDYANFKSRIASLPDQREKLDAYHELWHAGAEWQEKDSTF